MKTACILAAVLAVPVLAAEVSVPLTRRCVVANHSCFAVHAGFKRLTAENRIDRLNDRLVRIIGSQNLSADNIYVVPRGEYTDIYVGSSPLFTATPGDAQAEGYGRNTHKVADKWAHQLRRYLPLARPKANVEFPKRAPRALHRAANRDDEVLFYFTKTR